MQDFNDILSEILIDEESLQARIKELGEEISADYPDGNLLLICILRGGVPFLVDLSARSRPSYDGLHGRFLVRIGNANQVVRSA
jgi:hypoxanthine-guanine phosphoribosyltransferase